MSLFHWRKKKAPPAEIELADPGDHFSVAGKSEPQTTFEVVNEAPAMADPHARYRPPVDAQATYAPAPRLSPMPPPVYVTPRPVRDPRPEPAPVTIEWARRGVGPAPEGKAKGMCSGCNSTLFVSKAPRPLRVNCPVCGRSRVLS